MKKLRASPAARCHLTRTLLVLALVFISLSASAVTFEFEWLNVYIPDGFPQTKMPDAYRVRFSTDDGATWVYLENAPFVPYDPDANDATDVDGNLVGMSRTVVEVDVSDESAFATFIITVQAVNVDQSVYSEWSSPSDPITVIFNQPGTPSVLSATPN